MVVPSYIKEYLNNPGYHFESEETEKELAPAFAQWRRDTERLFASCRNLKEVVRALDDHGTTIYERYGENRWAFDVDTDLADFILY